MTQRTIRAVVFDLDGLMFNTEELYEHVGAEVLGRRGHPFPQELIDGMMGRRAPAALQLMIDHFQLDATIEELRNESIEIMAALLDERLAPMPGLTDLLAALEEARLPMAIATSSSRRYVTDVLGRFDWEPRFQFVLSGDDVTRGKPHPEIYQNAVSRLKLAADEVLVLEDSHNGCRAAAAAGTFAVAVPAGRSREHDFSAASLVIDSLADPQLYAVLGLDGQPRGATWRPVSGSGPPAPG